jgi:hypothetical protein
MAFQLLFTKEASQELHDLTAPHLQKQNKAVRKALGYLEANTRHPSLRTHKYKALKGIDGQDVFEAYAQNNTFQAYRIFWQYGPNKQALTILNILPHP